MAKKKETKRKNENKLWLDIKLGEIILLSTSLYLASWFENNFGEYTKGHSLLNIFIIVFIIIFSTIILWAFFYLMRIITKKRNRTEKNN